MKKLILACASLLAFSEVAMGEDVTKDDVIYSAGVATLSADNTSTSTPKVVLNSINENSYSLSITSSVNKSGAIVYNVPLTLKSSPTATPTVNSWSISNIPADDNGTSYGNQISYSYTTNEYATYAAELVKLENIYSYDELENKGQTSIYFGSSSTTTTAMRPYYPHLCFYAIKQDNLIFVDGVPTPTSTTTYYSVQTINASTTTNKNTTITNNYIITNIPANNIFNNCTSVTIGASITSITAGAFAGASNLTTFVSPSTSFTVDTNGLLYTASYAALVAVPAGKTGDIKLNDNCTSIYTSACANVKNVNLISNQTSISNSANIGGTNNKVTVASTTLATNTANGGVTATAGQILTQSNVNAIITSNGSGRYIDLSSCRKPEGTLTISGLSANCLLFLPTGTTLDGNPANVVIGGANGSCNNFVLTDKKTFYSPYDFKAYNVNYERAFSQNVWATVCLPFTIPEGDFNINYKFAKLTGYDKNTNKFTFTISSAGQMNGKTPYLINKLTNNAPTSFNSPGGIQVWHTSSMTPTVVASEATMYGIFETGHTASPVQNTSIAYGFNTSGSFVRFNNTTINPFRAYITAPWSAYYGSSAPEIRFVDEDGFDLDSSETAIEYVETENNNNSGIFNLNGQRVIDTSVPGMYINNNKKVLVK